MAAGLCRAIARLAAASYPTECCGILVGQRIFAPSSGAAAQNAEAQNAEAQNAEAQNAEAYRSVVQVVAVENAWQPSLLGYTDAQAEAQKNDQDDRPRDHSLGDRYYIDPADLLRVQKSARDRGLEIVGIYHSHPDHPAVPSECDRALAWPVYSYVIVSVVQGRVVDLKSWRLDDQHRFQSEPVKMIGTSANKAPFLS
ncbi:MAG: metal-dependent protease of the PAD1/JAB1 superfamily [Shackletoniella antarctica]|uniref:Metal-dependent protease of the PAD1/JAB1 superfamily n=1 Tax=Shackletoniella antarctica TaxID=268115 RepID=A0A2W4WET5_9CYAN|nr:MAG: metal-dependent protease of the PAD1/JAB1 superfamily [Shackletoniella antarctica]